MNGLGFTTIVDFQSKYVENYKHEYLDVSWKYNFYKEKVKTEQDKFYYYFCIFVIQSPLLIS